MVNNELVFIIQTVYEPAGMQVTTPPSAELEDSEYCAARFRLDGRTIVFRVAKITPTKIGQFVTIWKRPTPSAAIVPFDSTDDVDFVVISVFDRNNHGQFVFNKKLLLERGIMSCNGNGGKLAFRIYPPWTTPISKMAIKTQLWQLHYFFSIAQRGGADSAFVRKLFLI